MNFVRRRPGNNSIREQANEQTLECSHLSKLYGQCRQIQDSSEQEQMFYELLPIFHGVLSNCKPFELMEKFPDVHSFCSRATQMLVKEINLRAANQTSEEGSYRVFQYLEPSLSTHCLISLEEEPVPSPLNVENRGWNLLSCLNLLSSGHVNLIECIVAAYLPSTLVKCLYIFLDLPGDTPSNPPIFHHTFKQILQRLSLYPSSAEELARKDALCLLFRATCERCRAPNAIWRSTAACILSTVAQNGLTLSVVKYIHETKCIQEMLRISSDGLLAPIELFDSFVALLHVLRESTAVSHVLLDDFRHANGYTAITELILKLEQNPDHLVETKSALRTLISLTERLVTCGAVELRPKAGAGEQIHVIPGFRVPMPKTGMRKSVRNVLAFDVLQSTFLSASSTDLCLLLLDAIKSIYLQDLANYFILEPQCTLALFAKKIYHTSAEVQKAYFDLLDTLVTTLRYVPMKEISSIVVLLKTLDFSSCAALTLHHFIHLLNEYRVFRDVYHDIGLLELAVDFLQRFTDLLDQWKTSGTDEHDPAVTSAFEVGLLLMDLIRQCITSSVPNTDMCLRLNLADCLVNRLLPINMATNAIGKCRRQALNIMEELMLTNGGDELMPLLLTQMHVAVVEPKIEILRSFCRVLRESHRCRVVFRKVNGFVYVMQELVYLEDCLTFVPAGTKGGQFESGTASVTPFDHSTPDQHNGQQSTTRSQFLANLTYEQIFSLVRIIFSTLGIAMKFEPASAHYFATEIQYSNLTHTVIALGSFTPRCTTQSTSIEEHNASTETASVVHNGVDADTPDLVGSDVFQYLFRSVRKAEAALFDCVSTTGKAASSEVTVQPPASPIQRVGVPRHLIECCVLARYVYNLAIDAYDRRPSRLTATVPDKRPEDDTLSAGTESSQSALLKQINTDGSAPCPPRIVHSGAVISLLHLTAAVNRDSTRAIHKCDVNERFDWTVSLQDCLLDVIGELLQSERNQQVMCSVAMPRELLHLFEAQLASDTSPLHNRVLSLFECLVAQGLSPNDLRQYLRINNPLCCPVSEFTQPPVDTHMDPLDEINLAWTRAKLRSGGPLPLSQVKCLIATATPVCAVVARPTASSTSSLSGTSAHTTETSFYESTQQTRTNPPPFVEFDMGPEGFGCLFLPSIAPQGPASVANLSGAASIPESEILTGGVGTGERIFPPLHGFTFSTWVCVVRFDQPRHHASPTTAQSKTAPLQAAHLLTIVRGIQSVNDQLVCLRVFIHPVTKMLVVCTQERLAQPDQVSDFDIACDPLADTRPDPIVKSDDTDTTSDPTAATSSYAVYSCGFPSSGDSSQWPVGVWRHLAIVFSRAGMIKSSSCSVYLDGQLVGVQRLSYIGSSAASCSFLGRQTMPSSVCAYVGTPATERRPSSLIWRQGPFHLIEEPLSSSRIAHVARLGPNYVGSFQSPPPVTSFSICPREDSYQPLFSEEKLVFGIYASTSSVLTLSRIRKIYNQSDAKSIARQFYIAPKENATPIRLLHNSATHLQGPARPLGAVLVGYQGVRAFTPGPITRQLHCVGGGAGGIRIGLALVAMAQDVEALYAATKAACTLIQASPIAAVEMRFSRGYQMLAMLLRKKRHLLTTRILDSVLSLTLNTETWTHTTGSYHQAYTLLDHPAFEDLLCDLDLWRIEREHPGVVEADSPESRHVPETITPSNSTVVEIDYQLVANLLNHLLEFLSVPANHRKRSTVNIPSQQIPPSSSSVTSDASQPLHPVWTLLFDRVLYLLLNAHAPCPRSSMHGMQCRLGLHTASQSSAVMLINGRAAFVDAAMNYFQSYLSHWVSRQCLLHLGQLMAWTLPSPDSDESDVPLDRHSMCNELRPADSTDWRQHPIELRNCCFELLIRLILDSPVVGRDLCNELVTALGFDWFYLFFRSHVHPSTVVLALHLLLLVLLNPAFSVFTWPPVTDWSVGLNHTSAGKSQAPSKPNQDSHLGSADSASRCTPETDGMAAFRLGCPAGRWLRGCELLLRRRHGLLLDSLVRHPRRISARHVLALHEFQLTECQQPGFAVLKVLLPLHSNTPELFYLLTAMLLRVPVQRIPSNFQMDFDSLYSVLYADNPHRNSSTQVSAFDSTTFTPTNSIDSSSLPPNSFSMGHLVGNFLSGSSFGRRRARTTLGSDTPIECGRTNDHHCATSSTVPRFHSAVCPEAATIMLCVIRALLSKGAKSSPLSDANADVNNHPPHWDWAENYSEVTLRFLLFLYYSNSAFRSVAMTTDFINGLVDVLTAPLLIASPDEHRYHPTQSGSHSKLYHAVSKVALDFLKTIVTDSFTLPPSMHQPAHMVDTLLESWTDQCASKEHDELQAHILCELMHHFMATDVLTDQSICTHSAGADAGFIVPHMVYFCTRIVDKLWQGYFNGVLLELVAFLLHLIERWPERVCTSNVEVDPRFGLCSLYRSLSRTVLYQFSRPILTQSDQSRTLRLFKLIHDSRVATLSSSSQELHFDDPASTSILLCPDNADPDFPACLIHLLMQLVRTDRFTVASPIGGSSCDPAKPAINRPQMSQCLIRNHSDSDTVESVDTKSATSPLMNYYRTTFCEDELEMSAETSVTMLPDVARVPPIESANSPTPTAPSSFDLIAEAALQLWTECYLAKKQIIATLVPDTPLVSGLSVPSLTDWADVLESPCLVAWAQYVDSEAAGFGGITSEPLWGRIPGAPSSDPSFSGPVQQTSPTSPRNTTSANTAVVTAQHSPASSLHHQFSLRLSRIPGHMFRLGSAASSLPSDSPPAGSTRPPSVQSSAVPPSPLAEATKTRASPSSTHATMLSRVREVLETCVPMQLGHLRDLLEHQRRQHQRNLGFIQRQLELEWSSIELELIRERGLWGPIAADPLARWKLDPTEGPCRMRKRMMPNPSFYTCYPYQPLCLARTSVSDLYPVTSPAPPTPKHRQPRSRDSRLHFFNYQSRSIVHEDWGPLTPWLPVLNRPQKTDSLSQVLAASSVSAGSGVDSTDSQNLQDDEMDTGSLPCLRQSLDPEDLEQSLHQTASLLRSSERSSTVSKHLLPTDDLDEVITPNGVDADVNTHTLIGLANLEPVLEHSEDEPLVNGSASTLQQAPAKPSEHESPPQSCDASLPTSYSSAVIDDDEQLASHEAILRLLEPGERPTVMYRCARILGLDVYEGLLLFGRAHFYVIDGYTLVNTREIVDIDSLPPDIVHEPIVPCTPSSPQTSGRCCGSSPDGRKYHLTDLWSSGAVSQRSGKQYFKFPYEDIQDVFKRRYLLQPIALEVFNTDGRNFLLVFSKGLQSKVYQRFQEVAATNTASQSLMTQKNTSSLLGSLLGAKTVTQRWERGELSNFQYLMYLNTLAGRSYNDLMQYPIFPWVLSDYDSEELDLTRPETFRDFAKPMGAQSERRFSQFHRRFREWDDPTGETPPYHYGTHYSSAMIVASYLVRMEPFTQYFLKLQGGHFDLPDRMFHSVKDAWLSASRHNMADVRELIPEFFYLPDFLLNSNRFELGVKQNGQEVDHVLLPPWAKSDPREFIRVHREALESEYVSARLNEWIDLIFGYKQQGDPAVQASNVFHHLFYEGNVDIYSIDDPLKRSAVIGFINNFGQIPKQLFRKPHPSRRLSIPRGPPALFLGSNGKCNSASQLALDLFYRNIECLKPHLQPLKELKHAVGQIVQLSVHPTSGGMSSSATGATATVGSCIAMGNGSPGYSGAGAFTDHSSASGPSSLLQSGGITVSNASLVAVELHKCLLPPLHTMYIAWGFTDGSLRLCSSFDPTERARGVFEMVDQEKILCCSAPNKRTLITAGLSTIVRVWQIQQVDSNTSSGPGASTLSSGPNTAAGASTGGSSGNPGPTSGGYRLRLRADLCGHTEAITCLASSNAFNLVVSGSRDRTCILWDLTRLSFLRQLVGHSAPVAAVCISEATGDVASCAGSFVHLWSCNGELIACVDTMAGRNKQVLCVCMSTLYHWDAENVLITGGSDGVVRMWGLEYRRLSDRSNLHKSGDGTNSQSSESTAAGAQQPPRAANGSSEGSSVVVENSTTSTGVTTQSSTISPLPRSISLGGEWTRQLVCRGRLTMHTAFGRSDNRQPAAITALAISRDHRSLLIGDSRGRVHAWSVPSDTNRGGMTDHWTRDEGVTNCAADGCGLRFSLTERKHHCRNCGKVFCSKCSRFEIEIYRLRLFKPVRVCQTCYSVLQVIQAPKSRSTRDTAPSETSSNRP